ncbi:hypothetical protein NDI44_03905 [Trichocoleus sp. DQ-A3]|uniref:hypothetical protein n=1 Tax=Cyanophyceae TaxID=3028117 RepID=UPI001683763E|nr:hypothetical protein [Coleofasciculus sp. FACHB-125]MBD1900857.1 hypothetical protein [Coleofasciculus sp. FACHB-125]
MGYSQTPCTKPRPSIQCSKVTRTSGSDRACLVLGECNPYPPKGVFARSRSPLHHRRQTSSPYSMVLVHAASVDSAIAHHRRLNRALEN